jgi:hypothetical protein
MVEVIAVASLLVFALAAVWHGRSFLRRLGRANALIILLWIHCFRYSALFAQLGPNNSGKTGGVVGDLIGATIALVAVFTLHRRWRIGIVLTWLLVGETIADFALVFHHQAVSPNVGDPTGVLVLVIGFEVPMLIVTLPLIIWQLISRRQEPLSVNPKAAKMENAVPVVRTP